jgi:FkbM family methyltransferase
MFVDRFMSFVRKPAVEKRDTIRFLVRKELSRLPYVPIHVRLAVVPGENLHFWWSCITMAHHSDRSLLDYWGDDQGELRFLWRYLSPGMVFFDVGSHHGIFTVLAAKKLSSHGQVVAFEPSRRERRRFELHIRLNGLKKIRVEPYAVSSTDGTLTFFTVASGFTTMNSLKRPRTECSILENTVDSISLDRYISERKITQIDLMKIDVEGGELEALRGATGMLSLIRPILICEVLDWVTKPWGYAARDIVRCLQQHDYEWFDFRDDGTISPHEQRDEYPEIRNYLAVPKEKLALIERWQRP